MNSIYARIQNLRQTLHIGTLPSQQMQADAPPPVVVRGNGEAYSPMRYKRRSNNHSRLTSQSRSPNK